MDLQNIQETLVRWQLEEETDIFKIIHRKTLQQQDIGKESEEYYNFYRHTFMMELSSFCMTFPVGLIALKFNSERKKPIKVVKNINFWLASLAFTALPTFHLFMWGAYRRYFSKHRYEEQLRELYADDISRINRNNFKKVEQNKQKQ